MVVYFTWALTILQAFSAHPTFGVT